MDTRVNAVIRHKLSRIVTEIGEIQDAIDNCDIEYAIDEMPGVIDDLIKRYGEICLERELLAEGGL